MNLSQILEGWRNHLIPPESMKELIQAVHEQRMEICRVCSFNSKVKNPASIIESCTSCGCPLSTKTKALTGSCPEGNWKAIMTQEEKEVLEEQIKNKNHEKS